MASSLFLVLGLPSTANAVPPSNDNFADRHLVEAIPFSHDTNMVEASEEQGEPDPPCDDSVTLRTIWYEFTPVVDAVLQVDTLGSNTNTVVAIWTGDDISSLDFVGCDDDGGGITSRAYFSAAAGTPYLIQVGEYPSYSGEASIHISTSTEGAIAGTVTSGADPLREVCVNASGTSDDQIGGGTLTGSSGQYIIGGLPDGSYKVGFHDCYQRWDHEYEWFDDARSEEEADVVTVSGSTVTSGVDAELTFIPTGEIDVFVHGSGRVVSDPPGIDCSGDTHCTGMFPWDQTVTLTPIPAPRASFRGWFRCQEVQGDKCVVTMNDHKWLTADFSYVPNTPDTVIRSGPPPFSSSRAAEFDFDAVDRAKSFECSLDGSQFEACQAPLAYEDLAEGSHTFRVRAIDVWDYPDETPAEWSWIIDTTPPELAVQRPTGGAYVNDQSVGGTGPIVVVGMVNVVVRASDAETGIAAFQFDVNGVPVHPSRVTLDGDLYRFAFQPPAPGTYDIRAVASNPAALTRSATFEVIGAPS